MSPRKTKSALSKYMDDHGTLPDDVTLGNIAWFSVSDAPYDDAQLRADFTRLDLRTNLLPPPLRPDDAFEKAAKSINGKKYALEAGLEACVLIREAGRDERQIVKKIMREVKDARGKKLVIPDVGDLVFTKAVTRNGKVDPDSVRVRAVLNPGVSDFERKHLNGLLDMFNDNYNMFSNFHDSQKIRSILRAYMRELDAIMWKQSFYFVPSEHAAELIRLGLWLNAYATAEMDLIPLVDLPHLRERLSEVAEQDALRELAEVGAQIAVLSERSNVRSDTYTKVRQAFDQVMDKAGRYGKTLDVSQAHLAGASETVALQLAQLERQVFKQMTTTPAPSTKKAG